MSIFVIALTKSNLSLLLLGLDYVCVNVAIYAVKCYLVALLFEKFVQILAELRVRNHTILCLALGVLEILVLPQFVGGCKLIGELKLVTVIFYTFLEVLRKWHGLERINWTSPIGSQENGCPPRCRSLLDIALNPAT